MPRRWRGYLSNNVVKNVRKVKAEKNPPGFLPFEERDKVERTIESKTVTCDLERRMPARRS